MKKLAYRDYLRIQDTVRDALYGSNRTWVSWTVEELREIVRKKVGEDIIEQLEVGEDVYIDPIIEELLEAFGNEESEERKRREAEEEHHD